MQVLIVGRDQPSLDHLQSTLQSAGYGVAVAHNGQQALDMVGSKSYRLVISDWKMPGMSGVDLCRRIRERQTSCVYFILAAARRDDNDIAEGLDAGADDFIDKPFQCGELYARLRAGERALALEGRDLAIFALARLVESRDPDIGAHLERIRIYSRTLAQYLASQQKYRDVIDANYAQMIYRTSPLHDIGKVGIPDSVLLKPGRLTDREFEVMKTHTVIGAKTLETALHEHPEAEFLQMARDIALTHHEQFDGNGYPAGIVGEQIPLSGRIVALADVYDALTVKRVYKAAFTHDVARSVILDGRGMHFDPDLVEAFLQTEDKFLAVRSEFAESKTVPTPHATVTIDAEEIYPPLASVQA
jgi:putative two-component system response regulator